MLPRALANSAENDTLFYFRLQRLGRAFLALQNQLHQLGAMGILWEMPSVGNTIKVSIHLLRPRTPPSFCENIIHAAPNELTALIPIAQSPVVEGLRGGITVVVVGHRNR